MPRAVGQIDAAKRCAILEAAAAVFASSGLSASLEAIAQRAGVARQTLYNQFGGREALLRALVEDRRSAIVAPLGMAGAEERPQEALAAFAAALLRRWASPDAVALLRVAVAAAGEHPALARIVHEAGPRAARASLSAYLEQETALGRLAIPDPDAAAAMFAGMVSGALMIEALLKGPPGLTDVEIETRAQDCAVRFCAAFAAAG